MPCHVCPCACTYSLNPIPRCTLSSADKETDEMLKPHISDYVRGFSMDDIENEREYEEWAQAGKPEC